MLGCIPVILSGGSGTRLWPMSRELFPKQFQKLISDRSLLQETAERIPSAPFIVCNHQHRLIVSEQICDARKIIAEPISRNTAPAVAVAALLADETDEDAVLLVMPSDQMIKDVAAFREAVKKGQELAHQGYLVTFGIVPDRPHVGYGYIQVGESIGSAGHKVDRFVEKPDKERAEAFLAAGKFMWNSGIFMFSAKAILAELQRFSPETIELARRAIADGTNDGTELLLDRSAFEAIPGQSVDIAVMERTDRAAVIPVEMGWSDIGSWSSLWEVAPADEHHNALIGDVVAVDTKNSYIRSEKQLVTTLGVEDLIVVATNDVVLVAAKECDQQVKGLVETLKAKDRPEASQTDRVHRPWGWYQTINEGQRFRVKHILVHPGQKLSLQKHWHRSEHWVVVTGTGLVTCDDKTFVLRENESTFIPAATVHRLENPGRVPLRIIEVQSGDYVGEDDIVRLEDVYGRN
ncbi:MAG: mannose-1-phosphate guanylyltransferase/mannose-6-phosphate isomerase [Bacteroidota bacterium]